MLFLWFDHPVIEGWLEARLRAELHRQDSPPANDRPLERLEVPVIEPLPDVARESIELPGPVRSVIPGNSAARPSILFERSHVAETASKNQVLCYGCSIRRGTRSLGSIAAENLLPVPNCVHPSHHLLRPRRHPGTPCMWPRHRAKPWAQTNHSNQSIRAPGYIHR
jgi:hypothetical protein